MATRPDVPIFWAMARAGMAPLPCPAALPRQGRAPSGASPMPPSPDQTTPPARPYQVAAVVVAAGRGTRMGGDIPKQYQELGGRSVLARTVEPLASHPAIAEVVVVIHPDDSDRARA